MRRKKKEKSFFLPPDFFMFFQKKKSHLESLHQDESLNRLVFAFDLSAEPFPLACIVSL